MDGIELSTPRPRVAGSRRNGRRRVRHADEPPRHHGGTVTRYPFQAAVLYLPDGTELVFRPGLELQFQVSAPGYVNQQVSHRVRRRRKRNVVTVQLDKLEFCCVESEDDA